MHLVYMILIIFAGLLNKIYIKIMKKLFFAVIFTAIAMTSVNAQKFGAKLGLNMATLSGDVSNTKMKTGFHVGGVAEFEITDQFTFQPEIVFSMQGTKYDSDDTSGLGSSLLDSRLKLNYINMPLIAKYYVTESLNIQAGPQIGFLMSANFANTAGGGISDTDVDVKDQMNGLDYGVDFGIGYTMDFGLFIDARYNLGLADISDDNATTKNNVISVSVGYFFN